MDGYAALEKALAAMTPEEVIDEMVALRAARPRRRRLLDRHQVEAGPPDAALAQVRHLQRRRGRPRRIHGPLDAGGRPALGDRGHDHRRLRDRRADGLHLLPRRVSAGDPPPARSPWPRRASWACWASTSWAPTSASTSWSKKGAGAFVCGEETALMASIQGERGQPWPRPPYPAVAGLWGQPSNVNNVKSYAYAPRIIRLGADWFKSLGTEGSPGTAVFALSGMVNRTGLIEVPMGVTLGEIIYEIGGGIPDGRKFKAVQTGGPLGGCLPEAYLDTPVDFDSLRAAGAVMGSGGMIVADETTCMVEFAKYFMKFVCDESCGKCPPCRIGSTRMLEILERITAGKGELADIDAHPRTWPKACRRARCAPWANWRRRRCSPRCATSRTSS